MEWLKAIGLVFAIVAGSFLFTKTLLWLAVRDLKQETDVVVNLRGTKDGRN